MPTPLSMTRAQAFVHGSDSYVPAPDDPPANVPFYRAAWGLRAAWGREFCDQHHHLVHAAASRASWTVEPARRYRVALDELVRLAGTPVLPEPPRPRLSYATPPARPTEEDAIRLFQQEWRQHRPGERVNSKLAKAAWAEKHAQAVAIVQARYQAACAHYDAQVAEQERLNRADHDEWCSRCAALEVLARQIAGFQEEGDNA